MTHHKDVFNTPGRECSHAKSGCCPKCYDPAGLLKSTREFRMKRFRRTSITTTEPTTEQTQHG